MFIHIGERNSISDTNCIGIFNTESLKLSEDNDWIVSKLMSKTKTAAVLLDNTIEQSIVSPFTIIKRNSLDKDVFWRKNNV